MLQLLTLWVWSSMMPSLDASRCEWDASWSWIVLGSKKPLKNPPDFLLDCFPSPDTDPEAELAWHRLFKVWNRPRIVRFKIVEFCIARISFLKVVATKNCVSTVSWFVGVLQLLLRRIKKLDRSVCWGRERRRFTSSWINLSEIESYTDLWREGKRVRKRVFD